MREILFRGKRKDNGEWIEGSLILTTSTMEKPYIVDSCWCYSGSVDDEGYAKFEYLNAYEVIPESVSEFTGLTDKNGTKIFEGDIVRTDKGKIYEIKMQKGCWIVWNDKAKMTYDKWDFLNTFAPTVEVIGNIHDNPELLKGGG